MELAAFDTYLQQRIKISGKTGQLAANQVTITRDRTKLTVSSPSELAFSKRQLKYLTKRYLKKSELKNYLRVISTSKNTYQLKYYNVSGGGDEEEAEE